MKEEEDTNSVHRTLAKMISKDQAPAMEIFTVELLKYFDTPPVRVDMNPNVRARLEDDTERALRSWGETSSEGEETSPTKRERMLKESRRVSVRSQLDTVPEEAVEQDDEIAEVLEPDSDKPISSEEANADTVRRPSVERAPSSLGFAPVSTSDYPYRWLLTIQLPEAFSDNDRWISTIDEARWEEKRQQAYEAMKMKKIRRRLPKVPPRPQTSKKPEDVDRKTATS